MKLNETGTVIFTKRWGKFKPGDKLTGTVAKVFRARTGAVLSVLQCSNNMQVTVPVSKYVE